MGNMTLHVIGASVQELWKSLPVLECALHFGNMGR
jgi:hypothetical protein